MSGRVTPSSCAHLCLPPCVPVEVLDGVERKVEHDHVLDQRQVQATSRHVRAHHELDLSHRGHDDDNKPMIEESQPRAPLAGGKEEERGPTLPSLKRSRPFCRSSECMSPW